MGYFFAIVLPPVAFVMAGKPVQALLCLLLMVCTIGFAWPIASIWACMVYASSIGERRHKQMLRSIDKQTEIEGKRIDRDLKVEEKRIKNDLKVAKLQAKAQRQRPS